LKLTAGESKARATQRRIHTFLLTSLVWLLITHVVRANEPALSPKNFVSTTFTVEDGLPDSTINTIFQTDNGLLWVGTGSGLATFDGHTFMRVELRIPGGPPPSSVNSLVQGADGSLWVGSDAGVVRLPHRELNDPYLGLSTAYRLGVQKSDEVLVLSKTSDGTIWAGTNHGLYRFDGSQFVPVLTSIYVSRIKQLRNGHLMLITGVGMIEYGGSPLIHPIHAGASIGVVDNAIFDVYEDKNGTLWYCTSAGARTPSGNGFRKFSPEQPATTATYRETTDANGGPWLATGIGLYKIVDGQLETPAPMVIPRSFFIGKHGDLWIGTDGSGLVHLQRRTIQMFTIADGLTNSNVMTVLAAHDGRLWVGNNCGLEVYDGSKFTPFAEKDGLLNSCVWSLAEDHDKNLWIGTYGGGLFRYRDGTFTQFTQEQGLASRIVFKIITAQDGSLWIATPDGLSHMTKGAFRNYTITDGLSSNHVLDVHQDRAGAIWVSTQGGINRLESGHFVSIHSDFEGALARHFIEDRERRLYTTDASSGVDRIKDGKLVHEELPMSLSEMVETADHNLWFSGRGGLVRVEENELANHTGSSRPLNYQSFGRADGLSSIQAGDGSPDITATADGRLWVATVDGLAVIDPKSLPQTVNLPNVFVVGDSVDGKRSRIEDQLLLSPGIHHVEMTLAAVDLATPEKVRLQYKLEGVDTHWLDGTASRTIVYTNLPIGSHRLFVRATNSAGFWTDGRVVYTVVQRPYFYQTKLFEILAATLILFLLICGYLLRMNYVIRQTRRIMEARQIERQAIAMELHDTFLQGVQGLILFFRTATRQLPYKQRKPFEDALHRSEPVLLEGRSLLKRLTTPTHSVVTLEEAFAELGADLRPLSPAEFSVVVDGHEKKLNPIVQEELFKLGREAVFNSFKHAHAKKIKVFLSFGSSELLLRFSDDGAGIDSEILRVGNLPGHYGLPGMKERAASVGGRFKISSNRGLGTVVEVQIPDALAHRDGIGIPRLATIWRKLLRRYF
jgi:ligand-binding sensor domain-containing protein/signal transduction histidine kinase